MTRWKRNGERFSKNLQKGEIHIEITLTSHCCLNTSKMLISIYLSSLFTFLNKSFHADSSNIDEVVRSVLNILFFKIRFHKYKKA